VLTFLNALEAAVQRDPTVREALRDWTTRGQPYVLQQVLALAYGAEAQPKTDGGKATKKKRR